MKLERLHSVYFDKTLHILMSSDPTDALHGRHHNGTGIITEHTYNMTATKATIRDSLITVYGCLPRYNIH